jgi:hypothetical protein
MVGEMAYVVRDRVLQAVYRQKLLKLSVLLCYACIAIATTTMIPSRGVGKDALSKKQGHIDRPGT